jgi:hypothetical protein
MKLLIVTAAAASVSAAAANTDFVTAKQKAAKDAEPAKSEVTLPAAGGGKSGEMMAIIRTVVGAEAPEAAYSMALTGGAQDVVLNVTAAQGTRTLSVVKTATKTALGEWSVNAKSTEAERQDIVQKIAVAMAIDTAALKVGSADGRSDKPTKQ